MGENYDAEKLSAANVIYAQIQQKKNDIIELERIAKENGISLQKGKNITLSQSSNTSNESTETEQTSYKFLFFWVIVIVVFLGGTIAFILNSQNTQSVQ